MSEVACSIAATPVFWRERSTVPSTSLRASLIVLHSDNRIWYGWRLVYERARDIEKRITDRLSDIHQQLSKQSTVP
jgi:hypothetical protein